MDFTGLRVGIIGTGSSAIQSIPIIAQQAAALTVFQRTATYSVPAWNERLTPEYRRSIKADYLCLPALTCFESEDPLRMGPFWDTLSLAGPSRREIQRRHDMADPTKEPQEPKKDALNDADLDNVTGATGYLRALENMKRWNDQITVAAGGHVPGADMSNKFKP